MEHSDYVIFVDESGDHGLTSIDDNYPIFVLDFCIFEKDHYVNVVSAHAFLEEHGQHNRITHMVVERRGRREDDELELVFRRIRDGEIRRGRELGLELVFADKRVNSSGLQLADLTARPIGETCLEPGTKKPGVGNY